MDSEDYSTNAPIPNEGQQSENASVDSATAVESSPLPTRPGHHHSPSTARKRTNEEVYESMRSFKSTLTPSRSQKSTVAASLPNDDVGQATNTLGSHASAPQQDVKPSQLAATNSSAADTSLKDESDLSNSQPSNQSFVTNIDHYQQQLELEFQEFERSLHERNPAEELENMSWDELEARCEEELQPKIALEQEIMDEFSARFEVVSHLG